MSSKRRLRRQYCPGKRCHSSLEQAYVAQTGHAHSFGVTLQIYWCYVCRAYHLRHPNQKRNRQNFKELL